MNQWIELTDTTGKVWINLSQSFTMKRYAPPDGVAFTRIFAQGVSATMVPEPTGQRLHTQFLYTDVVETPEAIFSAMKQRMN